MTRWPLLILLAWSAVSAEDGAYLVQAAGCPTCHTAEGGPPLAGGRAFETPFGVFYSPNITPDRETGIGGWSRADFIAALKHGIAPDGSAYFPVFPYTSYRLMTDADAGKIYDELQTRPAHRQSNREHDTPWWLFRWMMKTWQWWALEEPSPATDDPVLARGRYLVDALGHCTECHTPRDWLGASIRSRYLAGTTQGPEGDRVPNITPDRGDGIGKWDDDDLAYFLESGQLPDGDYTGGLMTDVIDHATSRLSAQDRRAIAAYLQSVPALPGP